jgi:hypothetical protein
MVPFLAFLIIKRFPLGEPKNIEFRAEFFNLFNQAKHHTER